MDATQAASVAVFTPDGETLLEPAFRRAATTSRSVPHSREIAVFARRPGNWAVIVDASHAAEPVVITAQPDRHFFGHGIFSADGRLLYASENNINSGDGVVGIYEVSRRLSPHRGIPLGRDRPA